MTHLIENDTDKKKKKIRTQPPSAPLPAACCPRPGAEDRSVLEASSDSSGRQGPLRLLGLCPRHYVHGLVWAVCYLYDRSLCIFIPFLH